MIDFSNSKSIVIPEGEVALITCGDEILWQRQRYKRELAYLESSGAQWIDTGLCPNDNFGYEIEMEQITADGEQCPIGCMVSGNRFVGCYFAHRATASIDKVSRGWGSLVGFVAVSDWSINQKIVSSCNFLNNRKIIFNGQELDDLTNYKIQGTISNSIYLFDRHYSSSSVFKGRLYYAKITNGNEIVRDFIPVLDTNNKPCMYDKVSGEFFYNKGTGEFLYGEIPTTPYKRELEYLESNATQYINTGKYAPLNTDIEVKFRVDSSINGAIFGGRAAQTAQTCTLFYLATGKPPYFRFDRNSQVTVANTNQVSIDTDSVFEFSYKNSVAMITNLTTGEQNSTAISTPSSFTTNPIHLFAVNTNNTAGTFLKGKIYEWKYWENGVLLQHLIPVLDWDNIPCMYDKVSGEFFYNQGSGEFLYGE